MSSVSVYRRRTTIECKLMELPDEVLSYMIEEYLGFKTHLCLMTTCKTMNYITSKVTHLIAININAYIIDEINCVSEQLMDCMQWMFDIKNDIVFFANEDNFFYVSTKLEFLVRETDKMKEKAVLYKMLILQENWKKLLCAICKMDNQFDKLEKNLCSLLMDIKELDNNINDSE